MVEQSGAGARGRERDFSTEIPDTGLLCLVLLLRFHGSSVDPKALSHRFAPGPEGLTDCDLLRAARESSLKAALGCIGWRKLAKTPLPAIAETKDGRCFVLAKVADDQGGEAEGAGA